MLQNFQKLYNLCLSKFVILDFQFLSQKPLYSRRKDDIVLGNVVSTSTWIRPVNGL